MAQPPNLSLAVCLRLVGRKMASSTPTVVTEEETWMISDGTRSAEIQCFISYKNDNWGFMTSEVTWGRDGFRISRLEKSREARINNRKLNPYDAKFIDRNIRPTRWIKNVCYMDETWTVTDGLTLGQIDCQVSFRLDKETPEFSLVVDTLWGIDHQKVRNYLLDTLRGQYLGIIDQSQPLTRG